MNKNKLPNWYYIPKRKILTPIEERESLNKFLQKIRKTCK
jgi:hypothetical protein